MVQLQPTRHVINSHVGTVPSAPLDRDSCAGWRNVSRSCIRVVVLTEFWRNDCTSGTTEVCHLCNQVVVAGAEFRAKRFTSLETDKYVRGSHFVLDAPSLWAPALSAVKSRARHASYMHLQQTSEGCLAAEKRYENRARDPKPPSQRDLTLMLGSARSTGAPREIPWVSQTRLVELDSFMAESFMAADQVEAHWTYSCRLKETSSGST